MWCDMSDMYDGVDLLLCAGRGTTGSLDLLNERAPMSPVSVDVLSMLRTPGAENMSPSPAFPRGGLCEPDSCEARLLRPLSGTSRSAKGIVPLEWPVKV